MQNITKKVMWGFRCGRCRNLFDPVSTRLFGVFSMWGRGRLKGFRRTSDWRILHYNSCSPICGKTYMYVEQNASLYKANHSQMGVMLKRIQFATIDEIKSCITYIYVFPHARQILENNKPGVGNFL